MVLSYDLWFMTWYPRSLATLSCFSNRITKNRVRFQPAIPFPRLQRFEGEVSIFNVHLFNSSWHVVALESVASTIGVLSVWLFSRISRAKASSNSFNQVFCWQLSYILVSVQYLLGPSGHEKNDFCRYICTLPKPRCAISYHILQLKLLTLQLVTWQKPNSWCMFL